MAIRDTIAAIATPAGRGGVGIIRVSGPQASAIAELVLGQLPSPRQAVFLPFLDTDKSIIDEGIALFFPGPRSFTGEDVLELQGHGGPVVLDCLLRRILASDGIRLARPGEFSERAYLNDKIDLAQAEAIADLINAGSEQAARSAIRSLQGEFSHQVRNTVEKLIELRIYVEAAIDFPAEEIDFISQSHIQEDLRMILYFLENLQRSANQGRILRDGMTVVIAGKPNAGKSSLLNQLSGNDSAIVTDIPGTTRDVVKEMIQIDGLPIHIVDTAGLRDTKDVIEQEGIRRTKVAIESADVILWITDSVNPDSPDNAVHFSPQIPLVYIKNKIDLTDEPAEIHVGENNGARISLSAKHGHGIPLLRSYLKQLAGYNNVNEGVFSARRRHINSINQAINSIKNALDQLFSSNLGELVAEDLLQAQNALNEITGEFTADDLLGKIFSSFCIGK